MSEQQFFKSLIGISTILALFISLLYLVPLFNGHEFFSWLSLSFFVSFNIGVYLIARKAALSSSLYTFSSLILGVIFIKMFLIVFIVLLYKKIMDPGSPWFLAPFFIIYIAFTIFEVHFMNKLGRVRPNKTKESEVQG